MAFIIPTAWTAGTYSEGTQRILDGVLYEVAVTSTTANPKTSEDWTVIAVHEIQDYNSLIEAIRLNINTSNDPEINRSVPLFIQLAEESFKTRIRVPQQRKRAVLTVDNMSRVTIPGDLLEVINLRQNSSAPTGGTTDIRSRGVIEILNGNYEEYQRLLRFDTSDHYVGVNDYNAFDAPLYWFDSQYFWIAPEYAQGVEMELWYYSIIPALGSTVMVNNTPTVIERNWYTSAAPQMLLYGALMKAEEYLKDVDSAGQYQAAFEAAQAETQDMINRFENSQPHTLFIENTYSSRI